ncbi:hypothetical protein [Novosphingobium cyanobacteriorum]|uniref:ATPase n=1 Tax=Novosphingobium cyanobacteriorum TaxID=3024215 RepID=A0ABT6CJH2_9SPHN|nr:hypothetical protein [Novosphingobium cyanobacteriorum]MDF8334074.1 hypothetical protein [Novosphingobium cyanobacteriorum]
MNGGPRIISLEKSAAATNEPAEVESVLELGDAATEWAEIEDAEFGETMRPTLRDWIAPGAAALVILSWTGFFIVANVPQMQGAITPAQVSALVAAWSAPTLVVLVCLLLAIRTSKREANRFTDIARSLSVESERLEMRLSAANTELALARDFIAAQSRDLESLGRVAVERLSSNAGRLQELIAGNGAQVDRIGEVSANALENMEKLRGQLPVLTNSAKDLTNSIGNAGRTAHLQLEDLISGFQRLNEFGLASERQVAEVRSRVDEAMTAFDQSATQLASLAEARFAAMAQEAEAHRSRLDGEEVAALAAIRARAQALGEELASLRSAASASEEQALQALHARADALAQEIAGQRDVIATAEEDTLAALHARFESLRSESAALGLELAASEQAALRAFGERAQGEVAALRRAIEEIGRDHDGLLSGSRERLSAFEESAASLTRRLVEEATALDGEVLRRRTSLEAAMAEQRTALAKRFSELDAAISQRRQAIAAAGAEAAEDLARKLADLDNAIEQQRARQSEEARLLGNHCDAIADRVAAFTATLNASGAQGAETSATVDRAIAGLNQRLVDMRDALSGTDRQVADLTDSAVRLLELIQAGGEHTRTQIPEALRSTEAGLGKIEDRVVALRDTLREAGDSGRSLSESVGATRGELGEALAEIKRIHEAFTAQAAEQEARLQALRSALATARADSDGLSSDIEARLSGAIDKLAQAADETGKALGENASGEIEALAGRIGEETSAAIGRVLQGRGAELIARLEQAIDATAASARDTAIQMRDQLAKVDELAGNLENRVARARERAEEQVDNDLARRTALITESLNSTAIDIAKVLSADVSETAWASYLRGDRGIFTRRAVALLDNAEAKAVQQHYETDAEFREHVNRYIHDFEAMLRQLLSTRDGNALGVTLLSSDMGKLYVALAQGIERLRT